MVLVSASLLGRCIHDKDLSRGTHLHSILSKQGRLHHDPALCKHLVELYLKRGCGAHEAWDLFSSLPHRQDPALWNSIISSESRSGHHRMALQVYTQMMTEGALPSNVTFVCVFPVCAKMKLLEEGRRMHARVLDAGFSSDVAVGTAIMNMYGRCDSIDHARMVFFNHMPSHDVVAWNAILTLHSQLGEGLESIKLFARMLFDDQVMPDSITFVSILNACANEGLSSEGMLIHQAISEGFGIVDVASETALVHMYGRWDAFDDAFSVFVRISQRDVVCFNTMLAVCKNRQQEEESVALYQGMMREGVLPDNISFISLLDATRSLTRGKQLHACLWKNSFEIDVVVCNALLTMYGIASDNPEKAREVFDLIPERSVVSWNAMMAVYNRHGRGAKALQLYDKMLDAKVSPNKVTYLTILASCDSRAFLPEG